MRIKVQFLASSIINRSYGYKEADSKYLLRGLLEDPWYDWAPSKAMDEDYTDLLQQHNPSHVIARLWNLYLDTNMRLKYPFSWIIRMGGFADWSMKDIFSNLIRSVESDDARQLLFGDIIDLFKLNTTEEESTRTLEDFKKEINRITNHLDPSRLIWISYGRFAEEWKDLSADVEWDPGEEEKSRSAWSLLAPRILSQACMKFRYIGDDDDSNAPSPSNQYSDIQVCCLQTNGGHALFHPTFNNESTEEEFLDDAENLAREIRNVFNEKFGFSPSINYSTGKNHIPLTEPLESQPLIPPQSPKKFKGKITEYGAKLEDGLDILRKRWSLFRTRPMKVPIDNEVMTEGKKEIYVDGYDVSRLWNRARKVSDDQIWANQMKAAFVESRYVTGLIETTIGHLLSNFITNIHAMGGDEIVAEVSSCTEFGEIYRDIEKAVESFWNDHSKKSITTSGPSWWLGYAEEVEDIPEWREWKRYTKHLLGINDDNEEARRRQTMHPIRTLIENVGS